MDGSGSYMDGRLASSSGSSYAPGFSSFSKCTAGWGGGEAGARSSCFLF